MVRGGFDRYENPGCVHLARKFPQRRARWPKKVLKDLSPGRKPAEVISGAGLPDAQRRSKDFFQRLASKSPRFRTRVDDAALAQRENVREFGHDLFDVMRHQNQSGTIFSRGHLAEVGKKSFSSYRIKSFARFVQNEDHGLGHQRSGDENTLPLTLREHLPIARGRLRDLQ
jgi:hypothetical protein